MDQEFIFILIGMSLVTYIPRMLPLVILSKFNMPPMLLAWLKYIPIAVLASLLVPNIFMTGEKLSLGLDNKSLLASIPCFIVAAKTKSLFLTVFIGIAVMFTLQWI